MKRILIAAFVMGLVVIFAAVSVVNAQDPAPETPKPGQGWGRGMMMESAAAGQMHEYMQQAMADALGLSVEELQARHDAGERFWEIAEAQGLAVEEAQQLKLDARSTALDQMVEDGLLTQEQADWMENRGGRMMNGKGRGGCMGDGTHREGFGPGMRGRWSQQDG
jgi:hypothetical protein